MGDSDCGDGKAAGSKTGAGSRKDNGGRHTEIKL